MANKGSSLGSNAYLAVGDFLQSDNQCFFALLEPGGNFSVSAQGTPEAPLLDPDGNTSVSAQGTPEISMRILWTNEVNNPSDAHSYIAIMQPDGNLIVYQGIAPGMTGAAVWESGSHSNIWGSGGESGVAHGPYVAIMQPDGNFVVYQGTAPGMTEAAVWATNTGWDLAKIELSNVTYDLSLAVISNPQIQSEARQILTNNTTEEQTQNFTFECEYTESHSWSTTWGVKAGIPLSLESGVPFIAHDKVQISAESSLSTTSGGQQSQTQKYADMLPVKVPPHSQVACTATASTATVSIPFSAKAIYWDVSNKPFFGTYTGTYQGTTAHGLEVTYKHV
ncbi:MAG: ETX/MTX2 family pore-forming toxin [Chloroflexota bacterium]|nr:ETX/MTX2 family pore-forming toxin [Chloroflexota bacterium]